MVVCRVCICQLLDSYWCDEFDFLRLFDECISKSFI